MGITKKDFQLDVNALTKDQIESIKELASELHESDEFEDIFQATIQAVFHWIILSIHDDSIH